MGRGNNENSHEGKTEKYCIFRNEYFIFEGEEIDLTILGSLYRLVFKNICKINLGPYFEVH
jgi:hypothetical protein